MVQPKENFNFEVNLFLITNVQCPAVPTQGDEL